MQGRRTFDGGYETDNDLFRVRHYEGINAEVPPANIRPSPETLSITTEYQWYGPATVRVLAPYDGVTLYANRGDYTPLVEVADSLTRHNYCRNRAETDDEFDLDNGDTIYVAMCGAGSGEIELRDPDTGILLNRYTVSLGQTTPTTPTVTLPATPVLTATTGNGFVTLSWDAVAGATGYDIQQWNSATRSWVILPSSGYTLSADGTQATVGGLTNGKSYYFVVRSTN